VKIAIFIDPGDNLINEYQTADSGLLSRLGSYRLPAIGTISDGRVIPFRCATIVPIVGG
jgi:hypothetical protein